MIGPGKRLRAAISNGAGIAFLVLFIFVMRDDVGLMRGFELLFGGTLLIGIIATAVWVAWSLWQKPTTPTALELSRRFEAVRLMDGAQFEVFVADLFRAMGHRVVVLGGRGDQGVDIVVIPRDERVAVQCKNYSGPVGNRPVQEVYAGARHHRCVEAWVVAPSGYTRGALDLAKSTGVSLYDANTIHQWIRTVDRLEKEHSSETRSRTRLPASTNTPSGEELGETRKKAIWYPHPDDPPEPRGGCQKG